MTTDHRADQPTFRSPLVVAALGFIGVAALLSFLASPPQPGDNAPPGSAFSTEAGGMAAAAELLESFEYEVVKTRLPLAQAFIAHRGATHFVIDPGTIAGEERRAVEAALVAGDRVVVTGSVPIVSRPPRDVRSFSGGGVVTFPHPDFAGIGAVIAREESRGWALPRDILPVVTNGQLTLVGVVGVGDGEIIAVSDSLLLDNASLVNAGNARLVVKLAGDATTVVFHESVHGFDAATGFAALGARWRWALLGVLVATALWMFARSRRFGPVEMGGLDVVPPRAAYIDAVAGILQRSRQPDAAMANARRTIRRRLARRAGGTGTDEDLVAAAVGIGADEADALRAMGDGGSTEDLVATAKLLGRVHH